MAKAKFGLTGLSVMSGASVSPNAVESPFAYDLRAKKHRVSTARLIESLNKYAAIVDRRYFSTIEYNAWDQKVVGAEVISARLGSWRKALQHIGITGARERGYTTDELLDNLDRVWRELGYPPGKRSLAKLGAKISEHPYKRRWGSLRKACERLALFRNGQISEDQLLLRDDSTPVRRTVPLNVRWEILRRDNYKCVRCGASPATDPSVILEIDHKLPVTQGGGNEAGNLRVLCWECNQGKKDRRD